MTCQLGASIPPQKSEENVRDVHQCSMARLEQFTNYFRKPYLALSYMNDMGCLIHMYIHVFIYIYIYVTRHNTHVVFCVYIYIYTSIYIYIGWWFLSSGGFSSFCSIQLGHVSWLRFRLEPATSAEARATAWPPVTVFSAMRGYLSLCVNIYIDDIVWLDIYIEFIYIFI